jgi:hypothetical protein
MIFGNGMGWFLTVLLIVTVVAGAGWLFSDRQQLDNQINSLQTEIKAKTDENTVLKSEIEKIKTTVDELNKRDDQFKTLVQNLMAQIEALKNQLNEKDQALQALIVQNNNKDTQIFEMKQKLDAYQKQVGSSIQPGNDSMPTIVPPVSETTPGGRSSDETPQALLWFIPIAGLSGLIGAGGMMYIPRIYRKQLSRSQKSTTSYMVRMNRDQYYQFAEFVQQRSKPDKTGLG